MMKLRNFTKAKPKLGLSIYPNKADYNELIAYLSLASKYGFKRIFTNLIGLNKKDINKFKAVCKVASKDFGMEMIADIDETVLETMNVELTNTKFFKELGISVIRMDVKFDAEDIAKLSLNNDGMQWEINGSDFSKLEEEIILFKHNKSNIVASHNFFPQKYTGLSMEKFNLANNNMSKAGFKISAFVSMDAKNQINAWEDSNNVVTLEVNRNMSLYDQFQLMMAQDQIDIILVSNMFLTEQQFRAISSIELNKIIFNASEASDITENERKVLYYDAHQLRGDNPSSIMYRSTISRKIFNKLAIEPKINTKKFFDPGDIIIINNTLSRYKGELHIIKTRIPVDKYKNFVGTIKQNQIPLLDLHRPLLKFKILKGGD